MECNIDFLTFADLLAPSDMQNFYATSEEGVLESLRGSFDLILCTVSADGLDYAGYMAALRPYGVPAAQDLVEGHHTVTVTSCTYEQGSHRRSRGRTVYDNYFTMTLTGGTLHTTTIETNQPTSIQTMGGTYEVLYQACKVQSGNASMTLDVYEHSWIIVDARLN